MSQPKAEKWVCPHGVWTVVCHGGPLCVEKLCSAAAGAECAVRSSFHDVANHDLRSLMIGAMKDCDETLRPWREMWSAAWPSDEPLPELPPAAG